MSRTRTYTRVNTFTREEKIILAALNQAAIPIDFIALASRAEQLGKKEAVEIDQELCLTITGQLIERGLIDRVRVHDDGDFFYRHAHSSSDLIEKLRDIAVPIGMIIQVGEDWNHDRHPEHQYVCPDGRLLSKNDYSELYKTFQDADQDFGEEGDQFRIPDFRQGMVASDKVGGIRTLMRIK